MAKHKRDKSMEEVTKGYENFITGKKLNNNGNSLFEKVIKKAGKPKPKKQRGSK